MAPSFEPGTAPSLGVMPTVALVTAREALDLDDDLAPLCEALIASGFGARVVCWDDPLVDWVGFDAAVVRSAWDYPERLDEFLAWAEHVDGLTTLLNPLDILRWNADKRYLTDLNGAGVRTVPTAFAEDGASIEWPRDRDIVVKPSVSAGSRSTARFGADELDAARSLVEDIWQSGRTAMIQPYLSGVDSDGELGLVSFDGHHSHAFRKGPLLQRGAGPTPGLFAPEEISTAVVGDAERALADSAIRAVYQSVGRRPLYARVDIVMQEGVPLVLEVELIEPSVYHWTDPPSASRFADSIASRITG